MNINSEKLIFELNQLCMRHTSFAEKLYGKTTEELNWRESDNSWSILECFEHLNRYGDFYLDEIEKVIQKATSERQIFFRSGFLGNFFVKSILVTDGVKKMKTPKNMNPINSNLGIKVIDRFIEQQDKMTQLLLLAKYVSLTKEKTVISLVKGIKIRLGDTLRFVVYHNARHIKQIENILDRQKSLMLVDQ